MSKDIKENLDLIEKIANWSQEKKLQFTHDVAQLVNFNFNYLNIIDNMEARTFIEKYGSEDKELMPSVF
jgi:hypothetical protein